MPRIPKTSAAPVVIALILQTIPVWAQETLQPAPGDRIRVTAPLCHLQERTAIFASLEHDLLTATMGESGIRCPFEAVEILEMYQGRRHGGTGALIGTLVGGMSGALISLTADYEGWGYTMGIGVPLGAAMGAGPRARKYALVPAAAGAGIGLVLGAVLEASDPGSVPENAAFGFGASLALLGAAGGSLIGLAAGEDRWKEVSLRLVRPSVHGTSRGQLGFEISVPIRR